MDPCTAGIASPPSPGTCYRTLSNNLFRCRLLFHTSHTLPCNSCQCCTSTTSIGPSKNRPSTNIQFTQQKEKGKDTQLYYISTFERKAFASPKAQIPRLTGSLYLTARTAIPSTHLFENLVKLQYSSQNHHPDLLISVAVLPKPKPRYRLLLDPPSTRATLPLSFGPRPIM